MKFKTFTYIEVENLENCWAIILEDCKKEMLPITPSYIFVHNQINPNGIYIDHLLTDSKPEKIIDGINGGISKDYKEVGFWRLKNIDSQ